MSRGPFSDRVPTEQEILGQIEKENHQMQAFLEKESIWRVDKQILLRDCICHVCRLDQSRSHAMAIPVSRSSKPRLVEMKS